MSKELKQYTLADVKSHNNKQSAWIVIHNSVFDMTAFLNKHPGGEEILLEQAGKEASEAFDIVGHSSHARELLLKYKVGELIESARKPIKEKTAGPSGNETNLK